MGVVLLWLGDDNKRERNHENSGTANIIITTVVSVVVVVNIGSPLSVCLLDVFNGLLGLVYAAGNPWGE